MAAIFAGKLLTLLEGCGGWRRERGGNVHKGIHWGHAVGSFRHRDNSLAGRREAVEREGRDRRACAHAG
jgi:hypothetical protein